MPGVYSGDRWVRFDVAPGLTNVGGAKCALRNGAMAAHQLMCCALQCQQRGQKAAALTCLESILETGGCSSLLQPVVSDAFNECWRCTAQPVLCAVGAWQQQSWLWRALQCWQLRQKAAALTCLKSILETGVCRQVCCNLQVAAGGNMALRLLWVWSEFGQSSVWSKLPAVAVTTWLFRAAAECLLAAAGRAGCSSNCDVAGFSARGIVVALPWQLLCHWSS
jgi:hypothetical protein